MTNLDVVNRVLLLLDRNPADWIEHVEDRPNHDRRYLIDPKKIESLGWTPKIDFDSRMSRPFGGKWKTNSGGRRSLRG